MHKVNYRTRKIKGVGKEIKKRQGCGRGMKKKGRVKGKPHSPPGKSRKRDGRKKKAMDSGEPKTG